jgi:hypothetical protein
MGLQLSISVGNFHFRVYFEIPVLTEFQNRRQCNCIQSSRTKVKPLQLSLIIEWLAEDLLYYQHLAPPLLSSYWRFCKCIANNAKVTVIQLMAWNSIIFPAEMTRTGGYSIAMFPFGQATSYSNNLKSASRVSHNAKLRSWLSMRGFEQQAHLTKTSV